MVVRWAAIDVEAETFGNAVNRRRVLSFDDLKIADSMSSADTHVQYQISED
jgi:hypothetical protein